MLIKLALDAKLQKHQDKAVKQLDREKSLILYHSLGSGKTLTSIAAGEKTPGPKLVTAPASLLGNYSKELKKFNVDPKDYHLVSYEKFRRNPQAIIDKIKPELWISDEFHRTKDPETLTADTIREFRPRVKKFVGMTGTIAQNHPSEIAELLHTATGKPILGNEKEFRRNFIHERKVSPGLIGRLMGKHPGIVEEPKNLDKFKKIVSKNINTFTGDPEYFKHFPKVETEVKRVPMSNPQQKIYDYTFNQAPAWVKFKIKHNLPTSKRESKNINAFLLGARQASNSLESFGDTHSTPKMDAIVHDITHGMKHDKNFKGVVFSNFLENGLNPIGRKLEEKHIPFGMFTGEQKDSERHQMVHDYNKGKLRALLVSPAGIEGLDLKGTKYVGLTDENWNPAKTNQAIGRAARFKSHDSLPEEERKVKVTKYLSEPQLGFFGRIKKHFKPDTHSVGVDEYIMNRANEKERLNQQFTNVLKAQDNG